MPCSRTDSRPRRTFVRRSRSSGSSRGIRTPFSEVRACFRRGVAEPPRCRCGGTFDGPWIAGHAEVRMKLADIPVHVRLKLSALWASVMFCYVYGDFFGLFRPGKLAAMLAGQTPIGPTTQGMLLGFAVLMAVPSAMV